MKKEFSTDVREDLEINLWHPCLQNTKNQWTHIRQVFKDRKIKYYTNGKLVLEVDTYTGQCKGELK